MAYTFTINPHALKRHFSVYVVVAQGRREALLYVGKTGDNREGCNPLISRCGNHFSYNKVHSQVRNKIPAHESWKYTYIFDHFDEYCEEIQTRRSRIDRINEMERWLNRMVQEAASRYRRVRVLNGYRSVGRHGSSEEAKRLSFRTRVAKRKLTRIVDDVLKILDAGKRPIFETR